MPMRPLPPAKEAGPPVVAIGASGSDGLQDLCDLLAALPAGLPAAVLVVLHRPSDRLSLLRQVLARLSSLPVSIPGEDEVLRPGVCYVGEPAAHLALAERGRIRLVEGGQDRYRNRTIDLLFSSVAAHAGRRAIGVVLRGSLSDGARGLAEIHRAGGVTMVLGARGLPDQGMPSNAMERAPIDAIGTIGEIAGDITRRLTAASVEA